MTPPGVHVNKTAIAIIVGLIVVIVLGFKYRRGSTPFVSNFNDRNLGSHRISSVDSIKDPDKLKIHVEAKQEETTDIKDTKKDRMGSQDWKKIDLERVKIPDDLENKVNSGSLKVEEIRLKVMGFDIFTRTIKSVGECKGGVVLLHGKSFTSSNWVDIKTLHYIAAMSFTPAAIDLPTFGESKLTDKKYVEDKAKFMEELFKALNFSSPVIISPSMSGTFSLPYLLSDVANAGKKVHGFIPIAPVIPEKDKEKIKDLKIPAALVYGEKDESFKDSMEKTLSQMPNSRLFKIKDAGHPAYLNKPDEWHKILYVFIPAAYNYN